MKMDAIGLAVDRDPGRVDILRGVFYGQVENRSYGGGVRLRSVLRPVTMQHGNRSGGLGLRGLVGFSLSPVDFSPTLP
jgi:hypothetical protein